MGSLESAGRLPWPTVVQRKRELQTRAIRDVCGEDNRLLADSDTAAALVGLEKASDIVKKIQAGETTARSVLEAFIQRAVEAHRTTNCLTEILFQDALRRADELDQELRSTGKIAGPLHGVPVSLKDQFDVSGVDSTLGYVGRCFRPAETDCVLVQALRSLGAVVVAKTNLPQSIMWCETDNPLWGKTTNPLSDAYTPGGSTGGESALLASKGSMLGWGTDIGGSIRIPSHMMGLYGLKPSSARLPYRGVPVSTDGQEHVSSSVGPMARSLDTVHAAMRGVIGTEPWRLDARCVPIPWRSEMHDEALARPLTIGVLPDDGVVQPHPPVSRVLQAAVDLLARAGHDVFQWDNTLHAECVRVMDDFYSADGGQDIRTSVAEGGEPLIPHVEKLVNAGGPISVYDYWQLNRRKHSLQHAYLDKWARLRSPRTGRQADVLLMPPMPHPAVPHGGCHWVGYTKVWNVLDYPALVIPGGRIGREDLSPTIDGSPRNPLDEKNRRLWTENAAEMASLELPVGIQLVCRKLEEEKLLAIGKVLDDLIKRGQQ